MSEHVRREPRFWVPRAVLAAWLVVDIPASLLMWTGCPWTGRQPFCEHFGNSVGAIFGLLPMNLMMAFPDGTPLALRFGAPAAGALLCAWVVWKRFPPRLGLLRFALIVLAWFALSYLVFFGELFLPYYVYG